MKTGSGSSCVRGPGKALHYLFVTDEGHTGKTVLQEAGKSQKTVQLEDDFAYSLELEFFCGTMEESCILWHTV